MPRTIPQRDLRNQNAAVIARVVAGESFVVTRNGEPVAELRPITARRRPFVPRAAVAAAGRQGPAVNATDFRADLDSSADQWLRS